MEWVDVDFWSRLFLLGVYWWVMGGVGEWWYWIGNCWFGDGGGFWSFVVFWWGGCGFGGEGGEWCFCNVF